MDAQYLVAPKCIICEVSVQRTQTDLKLLCDGCREPAKEFSIGESDVEFPLRPEYAHMFPRKFRIVEGGTCQRKAKLVDNFSYTYSVTRRGFYATYWRCTFRPKSNPCRATVTQRLDGTFRIGSNIHNHSAFAMKSRAKKKLAVADPVKPVPVIIKEILLDQLTGTLVRSLPRPS